ncbi:helix-turn-helix domain-containing protein [Winogradskyella sediminis]|uniref:helix-turn-helix domain-containing protein n=1 Tax=Winogradskyella sediminis TaxID=1382466 RepID=UPI000E374A77|nr:excisionase family DNA binding protein [Winogradskyella sediminis]
MVNADTNNSNKSNVDFDFDTAIRNAVKRAIIEHYCPPKSSDSDMFTRKQTAKKLCISLPTLHDWTLEGLIRAYRIGSRVLYKLEDIENALTLINPRVKRGGKSC